MKKTMLFPTETADNTQSGEMLQETGGLPQLKVVLPFAEKQFPSPFRQILTKAPAERKIPSFIASLAPLCALATRVRLKYHYDQRLSALLLQVIIEAPQASGKSFAADIEDLLMKEVKKRDKLQRAAEQKYREKKRKRAANEKLEEEPQTVIVVIPPTISKTAILKRADRTNRFLGDVLTFWMFAEELSQFIDAGRNQYSDLRTILRTGYDLGSEFGMDFVADMAHAAIADINLCTLFCATPLAVDQFLNNQALEGGNVSRTILCTLEDELGAKGAIIKPYTPEELDTINQTVRKLMDDTFDADGKLRPAIHLDTRWIDKDVQQWCEKKGEEALKSGRPSVDMFRKRASVGAFRCTALCYYLYLLEAGFDCRKPVDTKQPAVKRAIRLCKKIYHFLADYIFGEQMKRWGKRFDTLSEKREESKDLNPSTPLFDSMEETFFRSDLENLLKDREMKTPARILLYQWTKRQLVEAIGGNRYRKINKK